MKWFTLTTCGLLAASLISSGQNAVSAQEDDARARRLNAIEKAIQELERQLPEAGNLDMKAMQDKFEQLGIGTDGAFRVELQSGPRYVIGVVLNVDSEGEESGILIGEVLPESSASEAGLQAGDQIQSVGDNELGGTQQLIEAIQEAGDEKSLVLGILRDGEALEVEVTPKKMDQEPTQALELIPDLDMKGLDFQGFQWGPEDLAENAMVFGKSLASKEEIEELRGEVSELKEQMSAIMKELKAINEKLEDK